jgi:hypothetical protein
MKLIRVLSFGAIALAAAALIILGPGKFPFSYPQPVSAQSVRFQDTAKQLYQRLPDFPLENQYVSRRTGKVATENTLARRLIQYHADVKGRFPIYRLDWKLTLADYLGVNEPLVAFTYPSHDLLRSNPMAGDRTVISRLNRSQRDALVQALVDIFTDSARSVQSLPAQSSSGPVVPGSRSTPQLLPLPKPGDAQLLLP